MLLSQQRRVNARYVAHVAVHFEQVGGLEDVLPRHLPVARHEKVGGATNDCGCQARGAVQFQGAAIADIGCIGQRAVGIDAEHADPVVTKARGENLVRQKLAEGMSATEAFRRYGVL